MLYTVMSWIMVLAFLFGALAAARDPATFIGFLASAIVSWMVFRWMRKVQENTAATVALLAEIKVALASAQSSQDQPRRAAKAMWEN